MSQEQLFDIPRLAPAREPVTPERLPASPEGLSQLRAATIQLLERGLVIDRVLGEPSGLIAQKTMELGMKLILGRVEAHDVPRHLETLRRDEQRFARARGELLRDHEQLSAVLKAENSATVDARALMIQVYLEQLGPIPSHVGLRCQNGPREMLLMMSCSLEAEDLAEALLLAFDLPEKPWAFHVEGRPLCDGAGSLPLPLLPSHSTLTVGSSSVHVERLGGVGADPSVGLRVLSAHPSLYTEGLDWDLDAPLRLTSWPTGRQRDYLDAIIDFIEEHGVAPTNSELAVALGVSAASVSTMLNRLEEQGWIERDKGVSRSVRVLGL